jgi:hypothetical protein
MHLENEALDACPGGTAPVGFLNSLNFCNSLNSYSLFITTTSVGVIANT